MSTDRREFLKLLSTAAAAAAFPAPISRALALPANNRTGTINDVEHIVFVMQENRSFDHYYGTLRGVRGYGDRQPLRLRNGKSIFHQPKTGGGEVLPFSIRKAAADAGRNADDIQYLGALPHGFTDATQAWGNG